MKNLWDDEGTKLEGDMEKAQELVRRHFIMEREEEKRGEIVGRAGPSIGDWEGEKSMGVKLRAH